MKIADSHTDVLIELNKKEIKKYFKKLKKIKNKLINCAIFTTIPKINLKKIKKLSKTIKNKRQFILSIEDIGFINSKTELNALLKLKPFSVTLTWNYPNQFGAGALGKGGLTDLGRQTIKEIEQAGVLVDTAHMNKQMFYEFSKITRYPIYNSHSNIYNLHKNKRNLTNKQLNMIRDSGGFLGLTIYQKFIANHQISHDDIVSQIDYLLKNFGSDFFGFGTDLYGFDKQFLPKDISCYFDFKIIYNNLLEIGYDELIINKIFFDNYQNFLKNIKKNR